MLCPVTTSAGMTPGHFAGSILTHSAGMAIDFKHEYWTLLEDCSLQSRPCVYFSFSRGDRFSLIQMVLFPKTISIGRIHGLVAGSISMHDAKMVTKSEFEYCSQPEHCSVQ